MTWADHTHTVLLKDRELTFTFAYPANWHLRSDPGAYYVSVQNVAPFLDPNEVPGGLDNGFVKVSFMVDPKTDAGEAGRSGGEVLQINGLTWRRLEASGGLEGDRSITLETVHGGFVVRAYAYITRTTGKPGLLEAQLLVVEKILNSLRLSAVVQHDDIPGAPPYPPGGKPEATPIGEPRVP